ncbi:MAG: tetratricopeptide repeat protein [Geminicoccaceae bacterium]|nr:tetratricopeptide repeat protein [Geminicoccaceae bacterium]MCS7267832.1 tetratricopeptide repeat protein [Geminicoccaceae bacterium]MDW8342727.1 tetratricopeptide repeat protein [Geminicoccaceae bacterium]
MGESIRARLEAAIERLRAGAVEEALILADGALARRPDAPDAHAVRAACLERLERWEEALAAWDEAIRLDSGYLLAQVNRAVLLHRLGHREAALAGFEAAAALAPELALVHANRAILLFELARYSEAAAAARHALELEPGHAVARHLLGLAMERLEGPAAALPHLETAIAADPRLLAPHVHRVRLLTELGRLSEALAASEEALAIHPDAPDLLVAKGELLRRLDRAAEALVPLEKVLALDPTNEQARIEHGLALADLGREEQARAVRELARLAIERPNDPCRLLALGVALIRNGQAAGALPILDRAASLDPENPEIVLERGIALSRLRRIEEAIACYRRAEELWPEHPEPPMRLGRAYMKLGDPRRAAKAFRRGLALAPDDAVSHSDLLLSLLFGGLVGLEELAAEHWAWGEKHGKRERRYTSWANEPDPERPLRIGFVSADLGEHPVGRMILPVLAALDRERYRPIVYSMREREDATTRKIKEFVKDWQDVRMLDDRALAERVRTDRVDVLVDLSGHTANNRLGCFALHPAPVQVSWLGYAFTTGLDAIDYVLADDSMVRPGEERFYVETVLRFPSGRMCFAPPDYAPDVKLPPVLRNGYVTFGSFNNTVKIGSQVVALWSRVLHAVPNSRLLLKWGAFDHASAVEQFRSAFAEHGIHLERLEFRGHSRYVDMLAEYNAIDIALDPFPYGGGMTSLEALWMGCPLVTLTGPHPMARQGEAFLRQLGETGWIAEDPESYVEIAAELASSPGRLAALRLLQRERMRASPLCNGARIARELETLLRETWRRWCGRATSAPASRPAIGAHSDVVINHAARSRSPA